ncbi:glycosyltransferase family 2 protein [candidate division KSB1 bacterium]|nr:glycosyltransferase family 2 protein [candidate division KSB1 bacterium]NIR68795.1 glycosyltransferase family 2 protein [candidate division KSB1 bacterium]NIS28127.1 glycosyltransferase family 2 protein [candidate division KSB1 bacterium]NIT75023.1 glycosyltransferase family 2 protein [candidate division KSB1 bacterium]NIU28807.1 glycosyltransferase family 2 protein [candidate division KSB1 bacterium]
MKKISVIIPTYNGSKCIKRLISSIQNQTGLGGDFDLEIIVVDDCSQDKTAEIAKSFSVKVLSTRENTGGPNAGRNIGLRAATGDYICLVDQDDEWATTKIQKQLKLMEKVPICFTEFYIQDDNSGRSDLYGTGSADFEFFEENETFLKTLARKKHRHRYETPYLGSLMFDKQLTVLHFEEFFGKLDFDWLLRLFRDQRTAKVSEPLVIRHVDGSNLSLDLKYRRLDYFYARMIYEQYEDDFPKEVKAAIKGLNGTRARYYYKMNNMRKAREYFFQSKMNWKTILYIITTFAGSDFVKKHFRVFGT